MIDHAILNWSRTSFKAGQSETELKQFVLESTSTDMPLGTAIRNIGITLGKYI